MQPSLMFFRHSMSHPSLGVSAQPRPSSPTFLCKAIHGVPLSSGVMCFLGGLLVLSLEDVCYVCSLEAAHKKLEKEKRSLYICVVAQTEVVIRARVSLLIDTDLRLNLRCPFTLAERFQSG